MRNEKHPAGRANPGERHNKSLGDAGERVVAAHLDRLGWRICATKFRCPQGEADVIAEEPADGGKTLVFIEVKTRRGTAHGMPREAVDARKQNRLFAVAQAYLASVNQGGEEPACRFDIAEVLFGPDGLGQVTLWRGAF